MPFEITPLDWDFPSFVFATGVAGEGDGFTFAPDCTFADGATDTDKRGVYVYTSESGAMTFAEHPLKRKHFKFHKQIRISGKIGMISMLEKAKERGVEEVIFIWICRPARPSSFQLNLR